MILTPRDDFSKSLHAKGWADFVSGDQFQQAAKAAMLQHSFNMAGDINAGFKMLGAKGFLEILMSLADTEKSVHHPMTPQLNKV